MSIHTMEMAKTVLRRACYCFSANSTREILKVVQKLDEIVLNKEYLGMVCWELANELYEQGQHPHKIMCLGKKGLKFFVDILKNSTTSSNNRPDSYILVIARIMHLLGRVCHQLKRFSDSISHLNLVFEILTTRLGNEKDDILADAHFELSRVYMSIGEIDNAGCNMMMGLELCRGKCGEEIGMASEQVADDFMKAKNFQKALLFYCKAEEIYMKQIRLDLVLLLKVRRSIAFVHLGLGDNEKALEVSRLSLSSSKGMDCSVALVSAKLLDADILLRLDRFDEAIEGYEAVVSYAVRLGDEGAKASAFTSMAKACYYQEKFLEAKKYLSIALVIVKTKDIDSDILYMLLDQISLIYELMGEFEIAISLAGRLMEIDDLPEEFLVDYSERLFEMIHKSGNENHILWLAHVIGRLKLKLGPLHFEVGHGYIRCATLYLNFRKPHRAEEYLWLANRVMDPDQPGSFAFGSALSRSYTALSRSYAASGCFKQAIKSGEKVVKVLELVPGHQALLVEAEETLNKLRQKVYEE